MQKTIFFDLGNVLLFFDHQKMIGQVAELCDIDPYVIKQAMQLYGDPYERGSVNKHKIFNELSSLSKTPLNFDRLMDALGNIFTPNLPVIQLALQLKQKGHRLFVLSNTCDAHFEYAQKYHPFLKEFDGYVLSYEVGARKPEKTIYQKALEQAQAKPEECFYTDDIEEYILAARKMKIDAERYTTEEELVRQLNRRGMI